MSKANEIRLAIVGACGRGGSFASACRAIPKLRVTDVCDIHEEALPKVADAFSADHAWTDYDRMLEEADMDAVLIATPMPLHVPQSIAALRRDLHVLCEVPAAVSVPQCRQLHAAVKSSRGVYMMAENYLYARPMAVVTEMVRRGCFGDCYYAEGEYIHELKELNETTPWRRTWQTGINGITYGTHSLGPILQWMPGKRVESVSCAGSGHHWRDERGNPYEMEDSCVMLCRFTGGALAKIRLDMLSDRPHSMNNHQLQGTDGCFESSRAAGEPDRIWLRDRCGRQEWLDLADLEEEFLPSRWKRWQDKAAQAGHGGGDFMQLLDFVDACLGRCAPAVDMHDALDMTLPGLVSQHSIGRGGAWMSVPDSRSW